MFIKHSFTCSRKLFRPNLRVHVAENSQSRKGETLQPLFTLEELGGWVGGWGGVWRVNVYVERIAALKKHHSCRRPAAQIKARRLLGGFKELPSSHYIAGFHVKCWWNALADRGAVHHSLDTRQSLSFTDTFLSRFFKVIWKFVCVFSSVFSPHNSQGGECQDQPAAASRLKKNPLYLFIIFEQTGSLWPIIVRWVGRYKSDQNRGRKNTEQVLNTVFILHFPRLKKHQIKNEAKMPIWLL